MLSGAAEERDGMVSSAPQSGHWHRRPALPSGVLSHWWQAWQWNSIGMFVAICDALDKLKSIGRENVPSPFHANTAGYHGAAPGARQHLTV